MPIGVRSARYLLFVFAIFAAEHVFAQAKPNVAVMPFSGDNTVSADQLEFITAKFTGELLATKAFKVLDRGKMEFILQEQGFQKSGVCNSSECKVQIGQMLGVDNLISGKLVRFGSTYALHLEYIDVSSGEIAKTVDSEQKGELEDVYKELCYNAANKLDQVVNRIPATQSSDNFTQSDVDEKRNSVPDDAIPKITTKPLSGKRKVALALWGSSLLGAGVGYWFNNEVDGYVDDYDAAIAAEDASGTKAAYDNTRSAETSRNVSYGVSISALVIGSVLWLWPEKK